MLSDATEIFDTAWWYMLFPGMALLLTVLAFNLVGRRASGCPQPEGEQEVMRTSFEPIRTRKDQRMRRKLHWALIPALLLVLALGLAACGDDDDDGGGGDAPARTSRPPTAPPDDAKKGGTLTVITAGDVDFIDPGAAYYQPTYMLDFATQRTLVGWPPDETRSRSPTWPRRSRRSRRTARRSPSRSRTGSGTARRSTARSRSADFKYAIERGLLPGVATSYHRPYFGDLVGYDQAVAAVEQRPDGRA